VKRSPACRQLKSRLIEGPPVPYAQINAKVGIAVRSIGSHRSRCLDKMRRDPAIAPLLGVDASSARGKLSRQAAVKR
jgi:hypothetical protein